MQRSSISQKGSTKPVSLVTPYIDERLHKHIRIYWHDYTSSAKCRVVPVRRVREAHEAGRPYVLTITRASLGLLPTDVLVPGVTGTGTYLLRPDWESLRDGPCDGHLSCYADLLDNDDDSAKVLDKDDDDAATLHKNDDDNDSNNSTTTTIPVRVPTRLCPRGILSRAVDYAATREGLNFLVGFEVEFTVLERTGDPDNRYRTLSSDGHAWSSARVLADWEKKGSFATAAHEMLEKLSDAKIAVEQFHTEGAPGQYEVVLPPAPPLQACDMLLHARQIIESAAARHGFRVTLHPRPYADAIGTGSHAHLSISSPSGDDPRVYERFYAGVLAHFPALTALTNSHPTSYERMVDGGWAGGRWVTWGTHNKETPLRKCAASHWEVKVLDGLTNPYLALAGVLFAGTEGADFVWRDCLVDPARLDPDQRAALGITTRFPADLSEALQALQADDVMTRLLGQDVVDRYVAVKKAEMDLLDSIPRERRRQWIMERY